MNSDKQTTPDAKQQMKQWGHLKGENSWTMFKVLSEFVEGFETLNQIGPCVSIFGSARTQPNHAYYQLAVDIARVLTEAGYGVITGGGPGIMEAANKGASLAGGRSVGLNIMNLSFEKGHNRFIDPEHILRFRYFFVRKVMFVKYAKAFVALPGGFGTMDELFEVLTLVQTERIKKLPVVLVGVNYWSGLRQWIAEVMLGAESNISPVDLELMPMTDSPEEVARIINTFYGEREMEPNFSL
jgi:uncharacterized protein (TIGR00730 family)